MKRCLAVAIFLCAQIGIYGQAVPDTADLILAYPHSPADGCYNLDSLMFDTTAAPQALCARGRYFVIFKTTPFHDSAEVNGEGVYSIEDINDLHVDYFLCRQLDSLAGNLRLVPIEASDSSVYHGRTFFVSFDEYIRVDTVLSYFSAMDSVESVDLASGCYKNLASSSDPGFKVLVGKDEIEGTTGNPWYKRFSNLGFEFNLHLCKIPLAWEITKGASSVYVGVDDGTDIVPTSSTEHRDLHLTTNGGNFYYMAQSGTGVTKFLPLYNHHGMQSLSVISAEDNGLGLVGFAPGLRSFLTDKSAGTGPNQYTLVDVSSDAGTQLPHVMSCSYYFPHGTGSSQRYKDAINAGICVVASNNNEIIEPTQHESSPGIFEYYQVSGVDADYNIPEIGSLGGLFVEGTNNNGTEDAKVLCVFEYDHSTKLPYEADQNCPLGTTQTYAPRWVDGKPMSTGINKFATGTNRIAQKSAALIDLVVPLNFAAITLSGTSSAYEYWAAGNSRAVPQAAAVMGLMNSVHDRLGKTGKGVQKRVYDIMTFTADKILDLQPQHTAQQSITSEQTAPDGILSRLVHYNSLGQESSNQNDPAARVFAVPNRAYSEQFPQLLDGNGRLKVAYEVQNNDDLKRSWAPRFGFGRMNAFRCLAHSIPKTVGGVDNVKYEYTTGQALDWDHAHTLNGRKFLHLGKFKDANTEVLVGGGVAYTGEPAYMNNNGKTVVGSAALQVSDNSTLVVDGIVEKATGGPARQISTSGTGLILATGWTDDVALQGAIRATDLRVKRSTSGTALKTTGASEVHDTLWIRGSGDLVVESGTLTLQVGSVVNLYDNAKIIVKPGAELILRHTARILDKATTHVAGRVVLEAGTGGGAGGKLTISAGAEETVVDADVEVRSSAELTVSPSESEVFPGAYVSKIVVKDGGKVVVSSGTHLKRVNSSSTTPALVIESPTGLTTPANGSVRLDVPVEIAAGGKVEIGQGSTLKIGALLVQSRGKFVVKDGATVQFLDKENYIKGILVGEGTPNAKAKFTATNETVSQCSSLNRLNYVRLQVEPDKWLYNTNTPGTSPLETVLSSYLHVQHAQFTNVFVTVRNMPILARDGATLVAGKMRDCEFKADRTWYTNNSQLNSEVRSQNGWLFLFNSMRDRRLVSKTFPTIDPPSFSVKQQGQKLLNDLSIESCKFHDAGGAVIPPQGRSYPSLKRFEDYPAMGVNLVGHGKCTVFDTKFAHLFVGVNTSNSLAVKNCVFGALNEAVVSQSAHICNNSFSGCLHAVRSTYGVLLADNTFGATMSQTTSPPNSLFQSAETAEFIGGAYFQSGAGSSEARNNSFANYGNALHVDAGLVDAGDKFVLQAPNTNILGWAIVKGRNAFLGKLNTQSPNLYEVQEERSDIFMQNAGIVNIKCGKNEFSAERPFQLRKTGAQINLDVSTNDFGVATLQLLQPKCQLVVPEGTNLQDGQHPIDEDCAKERVYRERGELDCVQQVEPDPDAFNPNTDITDVSKINMRMYGVQIDTWDSVTAAFAGEVFNAGCHLMLSDSLTSESRSYWIDLAVTSAQYHTNSDSAMSHLDTVLQDLGLDTNEADALRESAVLNRVKVLCLAERYEESRLWLDSVRAGLFENFDSTIVDLRSMQLAVLADTSLTLLQLTDSLQRFASDEFQYAKRDTSSFAKEAFPALASLSKGEKSYVYVYPNPASDRLVVRYNGHSVEYVDIAVRSLTGETFASAAILKASDGAEVQIDVRMLPMGPYIVTATYGSSFTTTSFLVVR